MCIAFRSSFIAACLTSLVEGRSKGCELIVHGFDRTIRFAPFDLDRVQSLLSLPIAVRYNRDKGLHIEDLQDPFHGLRARSIHADDFGAGHWWAHGRGIGELKAFWHGIDAEFSRAIDLGRNIRARLAFAHQAILIARLELWRVIHRLLGSSGCEFRVFR